MPSLSASVIQPRRQSGAQSPAQPISDCQLPTATMISLVLRAERKLAKHLIAHASYGWDRSISNLDFDDYQASTVIGGLALTF